MKKRMFMALAVALTGVSMVAAAGNGELKIQSETSVQKVHAAEIHQIGVEPIPATGQITIEDLLAVQGGETEDPRALEGVSDPEDVPVDEASVEDTNADEYASLAIANVTNYVNVRTEPNTDSTVVGKIYDGAVAQILDVAGEDQDWFRIISGNVEGYIKAEFFIYGDAAAEVVDNYVTRYAVVIADRLNVRQDPATDAKRIGYIDNGEKVKILENDGDWLKVQYTDSKEGYVSAEYVTISEEFIYAKTIEEEQAEIAAQKALQAREQTAEQDAPEVITSITLPATTYTSNAELRQGIIEYAMQYLQHIGNMCHRHHSGPFREQPFILIQQKLSPVVHRNNPQRNARTLRLELPRHNIAVMFHNRNNHFIARFHLTAHKRRGHQIDAFCRSPRKHDFRDAARIDEPAHRFP